MSEFHLQLGRNDQRAGRHSPPIGLSGEALDDWKKGHGPGWVEREIKAETGEKRPEPRTPTLNSQPRYTPFSTKSTKRRAAPKPAPRRQGSAASLPKGPAQPLRSVPQPSALSPQPIMGLFGPIEPENTNTKTPTKKPPPIPDVDRDAELLALLRIGISQSSAVELIAHGWTLSQLICRWQLDDWSLHPKYVQSAQAIVAAHCEQSWPTQKPKDTEVSHVGTVTEAV